MKMCGVFRSYLFVWKFVENLLKPQGFTGKFNEGVRCSTRGEPRSQSSHLTSHTPFMRFPSYQDNYYQGFLIQLLHTNNFGSDESQDRARLARVQSIHQELRGRFILKLENKT
jgi:hypothetical protein